MGDDFQQEMLHGTRRFILVERDKDLSKDDQKRLKRLRDLNQNIHTAMLLVEYFHAVLDKKNVTEFRKALNLWYGLVKESKLKPLQTFARLVRKYRLNIETYIRSHLTTAVSEGLNTKIKVLKRMGYGYTNEKSFMNKILQRCGFLHSARTPSPILSNLRHWQEGLDELPLFVSQFHRPKIVKTLFQISNLMRGAFMRPLLV